MRRTPAQAAPPDWLLNNPMIWWGFTRQVGQGHCQDAAAILKLSRVTGIPARYVIARLNTFVLSDDASGAVH